MTGVEPPAFESVAREVAAALSQRVGIRRWTLAREVEGVRMRTRLDAADVGATPTEGCLTELRALLEDGDPVVILDLDADPGSSDALADQLEGVVVATWLRDAEGTPLAMLVGSDPDPPAIDVASARDHLRAEVARTARVLAALLSSELVREAALREAARARLAARHDPLTGLLNRAGWDQVLADEEERASRYSLPAAVAIIDLDELKSLNDAEGHHAGDELLRRAADVLRIWHRRNDHVARLGGDEFAALLVQTSESDALDAAQRLRRDLADAGIAASVGTAGRWANGTLQHAVLAADRAMYADKRQRRRARRDCA